MKIYNRRERGIARAGAERALAERIKDEAATGEKKCRSDGTS